MATTTTIKGPVIEVTTMDADWQMSKDTSFSLGAKIRSILFEPGTGGTDTIVIKEQSDTGPVLMFASTSDTNDQKIRYFGEGEWMDPLIDYSASTLSTGHRISFVLR